MNTSNSNRRAINKFKRNVYKPTLDVQHNNFIQNIDSMKKRKDELESEYARIEQEYSSIQNDILERESDIVDDEIVQKSMSLQDRLIEIKDEIKKISSEFDEQSYYTNTATILFEYYDLVEKGDTHSVHQQKPSADVKAPTSSILDYFKVQPKVAAPSQAPTTSKTTVKASTEQKPENNNRGSLLTKYMKYTDPEYNKSEFEQTNIHEEACPHCGSTKVLVMTNDGYTWCSNCDAIEYIIIDHEKPSYRDPPKEISFFAYKRQNHLNEWISQIQGKETTEIPEEVYDKILMEIKKQKITNMAEITPKKIKSILKTLQIHKYYEHTAHIINRLTGIPMKQLSPELEEQLRNMFRMIQTPFLKHAPRSRKNFLSYSFVLHKMIQLLGKDEYLSSFSLLKSRDKLYAQDVVWAKICEELNWEFYPSL